MTSKTVLAAVLLTTLAGSAAAQSEPSPGLDTEAAEPLQATADVPAPAQDERKICRTEKATGSLTRRNRICLTQAQWREIYDRSRRGVGELQGSASGGKICHPDPADPFQGCPG